MKILGKKKGAAEESAEVKSTTAEGSAEVQSTAAEESAEIQSTKDEVHGECEDGITESFVREARAFAEGKGLSSEVFDEAMSQFRSIRSRSTPVTIKMLEMILKAINYDHDVAQAMEKGEIKGRNAKIEQCLMHPEQSDGLPHVKGSDIGTRKHSTSIFDLARSVR